eukprot:CAMPEP_0179471830 /NCGR_PEP_ID=MMETSP0799-20121207/51993_1 /TAXON_ID=46947 /ORGANISM="Geminigera cryophila, Strain CCMP2564" /LENGTH=81 /DNA_ID=CAMNT_0021279699 /DNA_START=111 /DNA_END=356 /DNA_ORIENTATION=+
MNAVQVDANWNMLEWVELDTARNAPANNAAWPLMETHKPEARRRRGREREEGSRAHDRLNKASRSMLSCPPPPESVIVIDD